jgi:hypothetical protein
MDHMCAFAGAAVQGTPAHNTTLTAGAAAMLSIMMFNMMFNTHVCDQQLLRVFDSHRWRLVQLRW